MCWKLIRKQLIVNPTKVKRCYNFLRHHLYENVYSNFLNTHKKRYKFYSSVNRVSLYLQMYNDLRRLPYVLNRNKWDKVCIRHVYDMTFRTVLNLNLNLNIRQNTSSGLWLTVRTNIRVTNMVHVCVESYIRLSKILVELAMVSTPKEKT